MLTVWCLFLLFTISNCQRPEVITSVGNVAGHLKTSFEGNPFSAFEGIPYAKPPVGNRRFQNPEPADPWTDTWNATTLHECLQYSFAGTLIGQEDCLYINVYVPREQPLQMEDIDVIVHIHGGGFKMGSGQSFTLPDYLMDKEVIFVTFNYRLDALGFLSTGDEVVPGNLGLKDQVLALKWIQDNIKYFGGNPESVTITGFSAGGSSTNLLYLSPLTDGLFHKGISHSGSATNYWSLQDIKNVQQNTQQLGKLLGCEPGNSEDLVKCLKERPASAVLEKSNQLSSDLSEIYFTPVIDGDFLPKHPIKIYQEDKVKDIPWIFSTTAQEGLFVVMALADQIEQINENWNEYAKNHFKVDPSVAETLKNLYVGESKKITYKDLVLATTEKFLSVDVERITKLQSKASSSPVYYYYFNFVGGSSFNDLMAPNLAPEFKGVAHGDDIIHLYGNVIPNAEITDEDKEVIEIMLELLTSFARDGKPNVENVDWKPTGAEALTYLNITGPQQITVETRKQVAEIEFWTKHSENRLQKDEL